jgi:hypothetical protein
MTDKKLGPATIERDFYTKRMFDDHLMKPDNYRRIQPTEAAQILATLKIKVGQFAHSFSNIIPDNEKEYLLRSIKQHKTIPSFYLTITSGLGCWLDQQLQPFCKKLPTFVKSSIKLTELLKLLPDLPDRDRLLLTADAVSMYTNIDTDYALSACPSSHGSSQGHHQIRQSWQSSISS